MIVRARLDLSWPDFAFAATSCLLPGRCDELEDRVRRAFPDGDEALVCLAVRSGFDALLGALDLPAGSEVLLSAVTIPDMPRIVRAHGLVPVPVDVDPESLAPDLDALGRATSPRSRVLVVAHLFGAVSELGPARAFARTHGLLFVEDCAQSYIPGRFRGSPESDVRMLSFGPIKTDTGMGGAVLFVRDASLRARMAELQRALPVQSRRAYGRRLLKYAVLQALAAPPIFALFRAGCRLAGEDFDAVLRQAARGFPGDLLRRIRRRPGAPLLALLARRLERPNTRVPARARAGEELARALAGVVPRPGTALTDHTHWVFPVLAGEPEALMAHLRARGFDATSGTTSLTAVGTPAERPDVAAPRASALIARILFVPAYPEVPPAAQTRLAEALREWFATHP